MLVQLVRSQRELPRMLMLTSLSVALGRRPGLPQRGGEHPPCLGGDAEDRAGPVGGVAHQHHAAAVAHLDAGVAGPTAIARLAPRGDLDAGVAGRATVAGLTPRGAVYAS